MCEAGPRAARWVFAGVRDGNVLYICPSRSLLHVYIVRRLESPFRANTMNRLRNMKSSSKAKWFSWVTKSASTFAESAQRD